MDTSSPRSLPELARFIRPWAFGAAAIVALGFHFLLLYTPTGWPLALFALIVTSGILLVVRQTHGLRNAWALWFLVPLLSACISATLYSSEVVVGVAFFTIAGSLAALAYWLTAPTVSWREGVPLWQIPVFLEAALPFRQYSLLLARTGTSHRIDRKSLLQVGLGLLIAGPVLLVFLVLFLQGDGFFSEVVGRWITLDFASDNVVRLFFDVIVVFFTAGFFWTVVRRSRTEARSIEPTSAFQEIIMARSFLLAIAGLFTLFAGFQLFYLFQGSSYLLAQGHTYADYAVSGYQQLCLAAALAFLILLIVYRLTRMDDRWIRATSIVIAATSIISTLSAGKRLWLYVDAYGLTLSRSWGMQFLVLAVLLFALLILSLAKRWNVRQLITIGSALALGLLSFTLLLNHEGLVARYNLARHARQDGPALDIGYLVMVLSGDAIPTIAAALSEPSWSDTNVNAHSYSFDSYVPYSSSARQQIYAYWKDEGLQRLGGLDLRDITFSDLRAERLIYQLPQTK